MSLPTDEAVLAIVRDIKDLGGLPDLADAADLSVRTLYRHIGEDAKKPDKLSPDTRLSLMSVFEDLGLLDGYDRRALREALRRLPDLAKARAAGSDPLKRGVAGRRARGVGGRGPAHGSSGA